SRKSANEPEPKPKQKKNPPVSKDPIDTESVPSKEMTKKRHSHHQTQKKETPRLEKPTAQPELKQLRFMMPEYTKFEMGQMKAYDPFVIPFPNLAECGYPFVMGDDKSYGVYVQQGSYRNDSRSKNLTNLLRLRPAKITARSRTRAATRPKTSP
ncbi:hypothetical protein U1Q18_047962, partial [Sarracenia purpurea var. burkii]